MASTQEEKTIAFYKRVNGTTGPIALTRAHWLTRRIARFLAAFTWRKKNGSPQDTVAAMAKEWRRLFGLERFWKIDRVEDETAYAEIHFPCSLEGTGDVAACHRLMEYDRALLRKMGGDLIVLESRADPRVKGCCKVAIRKHGDVRTDLVPAHETAAS
ncbi:hypothetical protein [Pyruvatibacter sp.]|uniref:hypothetical protein n=1 Tax=Pyruvatibacter sp. TaxID=1981328 RepID=UPI00326398B7